MADSTYLTVSDDLDAIRRSLAPAGDLGADLSRFLAACSGTLRAHVVAARHREATATQEDRP